MIRINLLPVRQAKKREYGRQQLVLFLFLIVLEVVVLYLVYATKNEELSSITEAVELQRREMENVPELESRIQSLTGQLQEYRTIRLMLQDLQANRIGPGGVLEELKYIMSPYDSERERAIQIDRGWDVGNIDPRHVWLESLSITPTDFQLRGTALEGQDVAEFLLRLDSHRSGEDPFFVSPQLSSYSQSTDPYFETTMQFSITGGIRYHPMRINTTTQ